MTFQKVGAWTDVYECRCPLCGVWLRIKTKGSRARKPLRLKCGNHLRTAHSQRHLGPRVRSLLVDVMVRDSRKVVA